MPQSISIFENRRLKEEFEDTKGVIRIRVLKDRQRNDQKQKGQKDKQRSTKHYTEDND